MGIFIKGVSIPKDRDMEIVIHPDGAARVEVKEDYGLRLVGTDAIDIEENRGGWDCPSEDCEDCEFNRSQSWCARALPDYKGHTELEKIRMEGFWEAIDWCEEHYKWMEEHWEQLDAYTGLVIKILEECYADGRPPTAEEVAEIDNYWNGEE